MPDIELTQEELHGVTSRELVAEAASEGTIPSGLYAAKARDIKLMRFAADSFYANRAYMNILLEVFDKEDFGIKKGQVFVRVSWEKAYTQADRLDKMCKLYAQLLKAVGATPDDGPLQVRDLAMNTYFLVTINEQVRVNKTDLMEGDTPQDGLDPMQYVSIVDDEQRAYYLSEGYTPRSSVNSFQRL